MAITRDLGIVTAYGYAKSKGYTGTEEEFAILMADYADVADIAEAWAVGTRAGVPVEEGDEAYHNNSKYYAEQAADSASAASDSAGLASGSAGAAKDSEDAAAASEAAAKDYADHIADPVSGLVTGWLNDHVDPDTGYVIDNTLTVQNAAADAKKVGDEFTDLKSAVNRLDAFLDVDISPNLYDTTKAVVGLLGTSGQVVSSYTQYTTTDFMPIAEGDTLHRQFAWNGVRYDNNSLVGYTSMARVCAYDANKDFISDSLGVGVTDYTAPEGTAFVRVSIDDDARVTEEEFLIASSNTVQPFIPYGAIIGSGYVDPTIDRVFEYAKKSIVKEYKGVYSSEVTFSDLNTSVKSVILNAVVDYSALTDVTIGLKNASDVMYSVKVDSTNITIYDYVFGAGRTRTYVHGLTLSNTIGISAVKTKKSELSVTITANGVTYSIPAAVSTIYTGTGYPFFNVNGTASWVDFSATVGDVNKDIWIFGDSYISDDTVRWAYYLNRNGHDTYLLDGYPGESSIPSYTSFSALAALKTPKFIVWTLGMNDGALYDRWKTYVDNVLAYCAENNVVPILATVPTVPSVDNEAKNTYVRGLGVRYIDFAKAVGADGTGAWYSGMLSSDNVHPTETGAKALYQAVITAVPELLQ